MTRPRSPLEMMINGATGFDPNNPPPKKPLVIHGMTEQRYDELEADKSLQLSAEEIRNGWHRCKHSGGVLMNWRWRGKDIFCTADCRTDQ